MLKKRLISILLAGAFAAALMPASIVTGNGDDSPLYSLDIDNTNVGVQTGDDLIGVFYEDINNSADGGLNAELIKNYSFENYHHNSNSNTIVRTQDTLKNNWVSSDDSNFTILGEDTAEAANALHENNTHYAKLTGNLTLTNNGYTPNSSLTTPSVPIENGQQYAFSMWFMADATYQGTMTVQVVDSSGNPITTSQTISFADRTNFEQKSGTDWYKVGGDATEETTTAGMAKRIFLDGTSTAEGKLSLQITNAGTTEELYIDMVSLVSTDGYGYGNSNYADGNGLRSDLVQSLADLEPSFVRFPGGCIIEGAYLDWDSYYNWENSVGPLEERKAIPNYWGSSTGSTSYGYMQSYGFGYHEILSLCEEWGAEPYPILASGVMCQARNDGNVHSDLSIFSQHIINLIDYCWGDPNSAITNQATWAQYRVDNGHSKTFNLNYIGIGNENWGSIYYSAYETVSEAVLEYVENNYPGKTINLIYAGTGPGVDDSSFQGGWEDVSDNYANSVLVDEHYYRNVAFMTNNDDRYNYYTRTDDGGTEVFAGEYATHDGTYSNTLNSALTDAAYMAGIERNSDVVVNASYAPLFNRIGNSNWTPDLIWFDGYESYGTPNYYVQQMYNQNYGDYTIDTALTKGDNDLSKNTGAPLLGGYSSGVEVDYIKITRSDGVVLLEDDFAQGNVNGWELHADAKGSFSIANGKMTISQASGFNLVWLPDKVNDSDWYDYKIEVEMTKISGSEGFIVGASQGEDDYYIYNLGGWSNTKSALQLMRSGNNGDKELGNSFGRTYYTVETNVNYSISFNYGYDGALGAGYTNANGAGLTDDFYFERHQAYQNEIYNVVSVDDNYAYIKLINYSDYIKPVALNLSNFDIKNDYAEVVVLTSDSTTDENSVLNPTNVSPYTTSVMIDQNTINYAIPANSFSIVKVPLSNSVSVDNSVNTTSLEYLIKNAQNIIDNGPYLTEDSDALDNLKAAVKQAESLLSGGFTSQEDVNEAEMDLANPASAFIDAEQGTLVYDKIGYMAHYTFDCTLDTEQGFSGERIGYYSTSSASAADPVYASGVHNQGVYLDGSSGISLDVKFKQATNTYSMAFWLNLDALTLYTPSLFLQNQDADSEEWISFVPYSNHSGNVMNLWSYESGYRDCTLSAATIGQWYHVAISSDNGNTTVYINGSAVKSSSTVANIINQATSIFLGVNSWDTPFKGMIDDLWLFDYAISSSDVSLLYNYSDGDIADKSSLGIAMEQVNKYLAKDQYGEYFYGSSIVSENGYSEDSLAALQAVYNQLLPVYSSLTSSQDDADAAYTALAEAIDKFLSVNAESSESDNESIEVSDSTPSESDTPSSEESDTFSSVESAEPSGEESDEPSGEESAEPSSVESAEPSGEESDEPSGEESDEPSGDSSDDNSSVASGSSASGAGSSGGAAKTGDISNPMVLVLLLITVSVILFIGFRRKEQ